MLPLKRHGWTLVGPAVAGNMNYYQRFIDRCPDIHDAIDVDALHFYGLRPEDAINYFTRWHRRFGKSILITESACYSYNSDGSETGCASREAGLHYVLGIQRWCQSTDWCLGFAPFGGLPWNLLNVGPKHYDGLIGKDNKPTELFNRFNAL